MTTETDAREEITRLPGDWYAARTKVGSENMAKTNLERRVENLGLEALIFQVEVPTKPVTIVKSGQKKVLKTAAMPGYVLIRMELTDESWAAVKNTPGIHAFIGATTTLPTPLPLADVVKFLFPAPVKNAGVEQPIAEITICEFSIGDAVTVTNGPFTGYHGSVSNVDLERRKLYVLVSIFGRDTPVELLFSQVERV